jgi:hypothetical protein
MAFVNLTSVVIDQIRGFSYRADEVGEPDGPVQPFLK